MIRLGEGGGLPRVGKEDEEAVSAIDLAPCVVRDQVTREPVVTFPESTRRNIAQPLDEERAVHDVREQKGAITLRRHALF